MRKLRPKYKDFANPATAMHHSENKPKINQGSSCTTKTHSIHALYIIKPSYKVSCMTQASKPKESSKSTKMAQVHQSDQANSGSYQGTSFLLLLTCQVVSCSGDGKDSGDGQKIPTAISLQPENSGCFELGFGQPMICAKYPYADQYYGVFSAYGAQISGRIMLPLNLATDDGPVYVNAKQYHGIIRRRNSRAKAVLENKLTRKRKPYMHHSRHLHAMRRPRGCGGRFLNKETQSGSAGTKEKKSGIQQLPQPTCSRISEVLQSESGTLGSPKEANGSSSNLSGSEVTSMYSRGGFDHFRVCHLGPSIHSFSGIMDSGRGIVMPSQGVAAADNCCNLKV